MKFKSFCLYGVFSLGVITMIGLSIWIASATAQDEPNSPLTPREPQPARIVPNDTTSTLGQLPESYPQPQAGPPVPVQYGQVHPSYQTLPGPVAFGYQIAAPPTVDAKTLELLMEYKAWQNESSRLVKEFGAAPSDSNKDSLRDKIVKATAKQFDLRQQLREREVEQLKERLAEVEKTVKERNAVKDKIVEKRVADILREPDQLQWEPLATSSAPTGSPATSTLMRAPGGVMPSPNNIGAVPATLAQPEWVFVPRTTTRYVDEVVVDANGKQTVIRRPIQGTEYLEANLQPGKVIPVPGLDDPYGSSGHLNEAAADVRYRELTAASVSVAEAQARVEIAEGKYQQLASKGGNINDAELSTLKAELGLAKLIHARAQADYEGNTKILELDVRQAESVLERAIASFNETQELNKRSPNVFTKNIAPRKAAVEQSRIELERAKTFLEIHQKSNAPPALREYTPEK